MVQVFFCGAGVDEDVVDVADDVVKAFHDHIHYSGKAGGASRETHCAPGPAKLPEPREGKRRKILAVFL